MMLLKLSLQLFPRKHLFVNKTIIWKKQVGDSKPAKNVSDWVRDLTKSRIHNQGIETNLILTKFPKIAKKLWVLMYLEEVL